MTENRDMVNRSRRLITAITMVLTLVLVAIPYELSAESDVIDDPDMLPPSDLTTILVETPEGISELTLEYFQHFDTPDTVRVMGDIYLWWLSRNADEELVHAYAPLPHVSVTAFNIFGQPLTVSDYEVTADSDNEGGRSEFEFDVSVDGPTPIVVVFEADGWIQSTTYSGERINDTFVPTISWIAGLSTSKPTVLNIAIPTVGQLFAAGGQEAVNAQLDLLRSALGDNEQALVIWEEASKRAAKASSEIAEQAQRWPVTASCQECPIMVSVPGGTTSIDLSSVQIDDFDIGKYAVTRREFSRFIESTGYAMGSCNSATQVNDSEFTLEEVSGSEWRSPGFEQDEDDPVTCVSWNDAQAYVEWLSSFSGSSYRLLSYSEWFYVARETMNSPERTNVIGIVSDDVREFELIDDGRSLRIDPAEHAVASRDGPRHRGVILTGFRVGRTITR